MHQDAKKIAKIGSVIFLTIFIIGYALFASRDLLFGVKIKNVNIQSGKSVEKIIKVTGNAKNAVELTLNGRPISLNQKGDFEETISLLLGYNVIDIHARDKFGHIDEKNYKITY